MLSNALRVRNRDAFQYTAVAGDHMNQSRDLRELLGLSTSSWAKALAVSEATVKRWEDGTTVPSGLHEEVMRGISMAVDEGADTVRTGKLVALGIGSLLTYELLARCGGKR